MFTLSNIKRANKSVAITSYAIFALFFACFNASAQTVYQDANLVMGYIESTQTANVSGYNNCFTSVGNYLFVRSDNSANIEPNFRVFPENGQIKITKNAHATGRGAYVCHKNAPILKEVIAGYAANGTQIGTNLTCVLSIANFTKQRIASGTVPGSFTCGYNATTGRIEASATEAGLVPQCGYVCVSNAPNKVSNVVSRYYNTLSGSENIGTNHQCALGTNYFQSECSGLGVSAASYVPSTGIATKGVAGGCTRSSHSYFCRDTTTPLPSCANGLDDDGDGVTDFPADPGCASLTDTTETNPTGPACDNGLDDDGDGLIDVRQDPGCSGPTDTTETNPNGPACDNGIDDDGDRLIDFRPAGNATGDPGCSSVTDTTETDPNGPACDNGRDDDSDSLIDARDPGCQSPDGTPNPRDTNEATQCQDAIDNDNDGGIDALDPGCYDDVSDPSSYNPNRDNEGAASFDANRLTSPVYTKFNTFLGQSNFLELVTNGTSSLGVRVRIYNLHGSEIARRLFTLSANSQSDLDINSIVRQACRANPGCGAGAEDVDGDGLVDTYGLVRIDFDDQNPNVQLLGRLANYRRDPGKDSFSFAFARELRNASKNAATYATANTMDPQARGFLVANWSEIINIEKRQSFLYELFDISGNRVFSTSVTLNPRQEVDMHAGHELRNAAGQPIEGVYLARVTPQGDGEYLFTVARYSANGTSVANTDTYNYAFGVDGRAATGQAQFAFITNQEGSAWQEVNYLEIANVANQRAQVTVIYRGRTGEIARSSLSINPKSQVHINASEILAQNGEVAGSAVVVSSLPGSLIAQSLVYYQNKSDMMVEAAYFSAGKRPTGSLLAGSTNTFLNMSNTIRLASTTTASRAVVVNSKGFRTNTNGGTQAINDTQNVTVGGNSSQSLLLSNISSIRENSYGPLTIRGLVSGELVAEVLRVRTQENGQKIDYVMPTLVR